jgi:hypothetical protein
MIRKNMKNLKSFIFTLLISFATAIAVGQANPFIQVLPENSGIVAVDATLDLTITIGNTGTDNIAVSKLRPVVQVPASVAFLPSLEQTGLPTGWTILSNTGSQLRICNSGDIIPGLTNRTIILKVKGISVAPPTTFSGNIFFGNGTTCAAGTSVSGDNTADNSASSTVEVVAAPVPVKLLNFYALLDNCEPALKWTTEYEVNIDRFQIERSTDNGNDWKMIGSLPATELGSTKSNYLFRDNNSAVLKNKIFYRLKIIDKDGSFKYSEILLVNINCKTTTLNVYPNPVKNGKLYVSVLGIQANTQAILFSTSGQNILQTKISNGTNLIDVAAVRNGIYFLHVKEENGITSRLKVIIQD